jgi:histidinol phosphate phosphatase hisN-like protein
VSLADGPAPTRDELREHLVRTLIAGPVATPRQGNLLHYRRMAARKPYYLFGLELENDWTFDEIFALMVKKCGIDPDPSHLYGDDTIDPDLTIDALDAMAGRLNEAAERRETVLLATGHPAGLLPVYLAVGRALRARGCRVLTPAAGWAYDVETPRGVERRQIRYIEGVAALSGGASLHHTHDPHPMRFCENFPRPPDRGRIWPSRTTDGPGRPARRASTRWASRTAMILPCSRGRLRAGCTLWYRWTTTCSRITTRRSLCIF